MAEFKNSFSILSSIEAQAPCPVFRHCTSMMQSELLISMSLHNNLFPPGLSELVKCWNLLGISHVLGLDHPYLLTGKIVKALGFSVLLQPPWA